MEHETFGKIVAALRKEQINFANGYSWSQQKLADETGLTKRIVSKIERGRQARLDGEILRTLAEALELTSLERYEFFAMASEVADRDVMREDVCNEEVLSQVWTLLDALYAPLRQVLGHGWQPIALANVQEWRVMTLRYRHTPRFQKLFATLSAYPDFRMLWMAGHDHERAIEDCSRLRSFVYTHGVHGPVAYTVFTNTSISTYGCLYLSTFVPQNRSTTALFQELAGENNHALPLALWPNPSLTLSSAARPQ